MEGREMLRRLVIALMLFSLSSSANAITVRFKDYTNPRNSWSKAADKVYLDGVKEGLIMFDAELAVAGRQRFFCMPDNLALTVEQAEDIMMREAQKSTDPANVPISLLLIDGLKDTFPCQH
jgi:hypothetical protein